MLSERQVQKESRSCGGLFALFNDFVELAKEAPSAYPDVSFS
jgi:hypothetical protein